MMDLEYLEKIRLEALKYKSRTEFFKKNRPFYIKCLKLKKMDDFCSHMINYRTLRGENHKNSTMSDQFLLDLAKTFSQKSHMKEKHGTAYRAIRTRGLSEIAFSHMLPVGNTFYRKVYSFENSDNSVYVGLSFDPKKRRAGHLASRGIVYLKSIETVQVFNILTDFIPVKEAQEKEAYFIEKYRQDGWTILNIAKAGALGGPMLRDRDLACFSDALQYSDRQSFKKGSKSSYNYACNHNLMRKACSHMEPARNTPWEDYELAEIASSCKTRYEFKRKSAGAYKCAIKRKILNQICSHMPDCRILTKSERPK